MSARRIFGSIPMLACAAAALAQTHAPAPAAPTQAGFRISGKVVDFVSGGPIAGATVAIAPVTARNDWQSTQTGADGSFVFQNLRPDKYSLLAGERGFGFQFFNEHGGYSTAIVTGAGLISENLVFRLPPQASIHGQLLDEANEPVANADVMLFRRALPFGHDSTVLRARANSDDQGRFHFGRLPAGNYLIAVAAHPWYAQNQPPARYDAIGVPAGETAPLPEPDDQRSPLDLAYPLTFYPGATDADQAGVVTLSPGERAEADVTLRAVPAVRLRVDLGPAAQNGGSVNLTQSVFGEEESVPGVQLTSRGSGVWQLEGVAPGAYTADLHTPAGNTRTTVDLKQDSELSADQAQPPAAITGNLNFTQAPPADERFYIRLVSAAGGARFITIAAAPKYDFTFGEAHIPPGAYTVLLENSAGFLISSIGAADAQVRGHTVQIADDPVTLSVFASRGSAKIDGLALKQGKPFAGAMIILVPHDPENNVALFRFDQSDSDGTFTLADILPGQYRVVAIEDGWQLEWSNPAALAKYLPRAVTAQLPPGAARRLTLSVQPK